MTTLPGPHSGDDTYDLIDDALYQLAEHCVRDRAERGRDDRLVERFRLTAVWPDLARGFPVS